MNKPIIPSVEESKVRMLAVLAAQKRAQLRQGPPDARLSLIHI